MTTNNVSSSSSGGIGFFGLLAIVFVTLKLLGFIAWPWWVVLLPVYPLIFFVTLLFIGLLVGLGAVLYSTFKR